MLVFSLTGTLLKISNTTENEGSVNFEINGQLMLGSNLLLWGPWKLVVLYYTLNFYTGLVECVCAPLCIVIFDSFLALRLHNTVYYYIIRIYNTSLYQHYFRTWFCIPRYLLLLFNTEHRSYSFWHDWIESYHNDRKPPQLGSKHFRLRSKRKIQFKIRNYATCSMLEIIK